MGAADFGGVDIGEAVGAEFAVAEVIDAAGHDDAGVFGVADLADVLVGVGGVADEGEAEVGLNGFEGLTDLKGVVFGFEAADIEEVAAGLKVQAIEDGGGGFPAGVGSVGDEGGLFAVGFEVVALDRGGVGNDDVGEPGGEAFGDVEPPFAGAVPFFAKAFDAVDVEGDGDAEESGDGGEDGVGSVADENGVGAEEDDMEGGEKRVGEGIEVFVADCGEVDEVDATVGGGGVGVAAVNVDFVAALG